MMNLNIFAAFIAIISTTFFRRSSKEQRKKMKAVTWKSTFLYFGLCILSLVVFWKIYQVPKLVNYIDLKAYKQATTKACSTTTWRGQEILDSLNLDIRNSCSGTNYFTSSAKDKEYMTQIIFDFDFVHDSLYNSCTCDYEDWMYDRFHPDSLRKYRLTIASKGMQTIYIANFTKKSNEDTLSIAPYSAYYTTLKNPLAQRLVGDTTLCKQLGSSARVAMALLDFDDNPRDSILNFMGSNLNRLHFLSLCDISQCVYTLKVKTDCPLKRFNVGFDLPVEFSGLPQGTIIDAFEAQLQDLDAINAKGEATYHFFVKFPTLANMQLIRTLVLTTVLSALLTLFFVNCYYLFRRYILEKRKSLKGFFSDSERSLFKKVCHYSVIYFILACLVYAFMLFFNLRFHFHYGLAGYLGYALAVILFAIPLIAPIATYIYIYLKARKRNKTAFTN